MNTKNAIARLWAWMKGTPGSEIATPHPFTPFDLARAMDGDELITRNGRRARLLCVSKPDIHPVFPLTAEVEGFPGTISYTIDGRYFHEQMPGDLDLFMRHPRRREIGNLWPCVGDTVRLTTSNFICDYFHRDQICHNEDIRGAVGTVTELFVPSQPGRPPLAMCALEIGIGDNRNVLCLVADLDVLVCKNA